MQCTKTDLNKTLRVKREELEKDRTRYKADAGTKSLGRLAVDIAKKIQGKHKAHYCDFRDTGDFVVIENIENLKFTGNNKAKQKIYYSYSGYKGNVKSIDLDTLIKKNPEKVLWFAVRGMLPKNKLRASRMKRLKMSKGTTDKYDNFKPVNLYK